MQNRVSQALPRLPEEVRQIGVTTVKSSPNLTMVVHIVSPDERYDELYLRNYAVLQVKDRLARIPGVGQVQVFGGGDYAMRIWLDPQQIASRGLTAGDVVGAIREQNVQVAAGVVGGSPMPDKIAYQLSVNARGRLTNEEEFGQIVIKTGANGEITRLKDVARIELAAGSYSLRSCLNNKPAVGIGIFQAPGSNALQLSADVRATMAEIKTTMPQGVDYSVVYDPTKFVRESINEVIKTLFEATLLVVIVVVAVPPDLARVDHPAGGGAGLHRRHVRRAADVRVLHQHPLALRAGARHRHRGGRRHRRRRERGAEHRGRACRRSRRPTRPWTRSAGRSSPSPWCSARCSCRSPSSAASPGSSTASSP